MGRIQEALSAKRKKQLMFRRVEKTAFCLNKGCQLITLGLRMKFLEKLNTFM